MRHARVTTECLEGNVCAKGSAASRGDHLVMGCTAVITTYLGGRVSLYDGADCGDPVTFPETATSFAELLGRACELSASRRAVLGICGPPGVGKSTLGRAIVDEIGVKAQLVGMDGFHLPKARLNELGRLNRMGAIDTFDAWGFVALVRRLRNSPEEVIYAA